MSRVFNITADCKPEEHYMVNLEGRLEEIKKLVDSGKYFTINRARQYGKTTTLRALNRYLQKDYYVVLMDFQKFGAGEFENENIFALSFARSFLRIFRWNKLKVSDELEYVLNGLKQCVETESPNFRLQRLFEDLSDICGASDKKIVLLIDEVDSAANNQVFLDFLAQLRAYYIDRDILPAFQSVILAGVYDIKNLRMKIRANEDHKVNSPWNIASDFNIEMSFSAEEISCMLAEYDNDHGTGMDREEIASLIYDYTSGYPFLVSKICKLIDEQVSGNGKFESHSSAWTKEGILEAVKILLAEKNTLFESMANKLLDYPELKEMIYTILFTGKDISYNPLNHVTEIATMFGFVKNRNGIVYIANRIFETVFYNLFLTSAEVQGSDIYKAAVRSKNQFIENGRLKMELILEKFVAHFDDLYGDQTDTFKEEDGRRYFLLYLRPIINGTGNYYIEARTRNMERTDVIVDYNGEQFIVELKIWHGDSYRKRGEKQLAGYLDHYHVNKGYMLSFNFNKNKEIGLKHILIGDKEIVEAVV